MPGQIWGDTAPKLKGRTVKILRIDKSSVTCALQTKANGEVAEAGEKVSILIDAFEQMELLHDPLIASGESDKARKIEEWWTNCPIRTWIEASGQTQRMIASSCGVSLATIQNWLKGMAPREKHRERFAEFMGIELDEFNKAWDRWMEARPE
jgi:hypothetical protein